jgi:hypothetical protein
VSVLRICTAPTRRAPRLGRSERVCTNRSGSWGGRLRGRSSRYGNIVGGVLFVALLNHGQVAADRAAVDRDAGDGDRQWCRRSGVGLARPRSPRTFQSSVEVTDRRRQFVREELGALRHRHLNTSVSLRNPWIPLRGSWAHGLVTELLNC